MNAFTILAALAVAIAAGWLVGRTPSFEDRTNKEQ